MPKSGTPTNIQTGIVFADLHTPHESKGAIEILKNIIKDVKPSIVVCLGDTIEFDSINHFTKNKPLLREGKRIKQEVDYANEMLGYIRKSMPHKCIFVHLTGNHEERLIRYTEEHPELEGVFPADIPSRNILFSSVDVNIPHGGFYTEGKLIFHHGDRKGYQSVHHAKQWASIGKSVVYGHHHSVQRFPHETISYKGKPEPHAAFGIGCMCSRNRDWIYNQKTLWQQSIGLFYQNPVFFNFYNIDIIDGFAIFNNKIYGG